MFFLGGFKVWESSLDLCRYLATSDSKQVINEKTILELGCGAGLPGIVSLLQNANKVCFQDLVRKIYPIWNFWNNILYFFHRIKK